MIISLRNMTYEELKSKLTPDDKIVIYSCNACIVACGVGGRVNMKTLEDSLASDGFQVIGQDIISIGCTKDLVRRRQEDFTKKKIYEDATAIIALICEDGYETLAEVFPDKKVISTTKTLGVGKFSPTRGVVLTTPFESTGLEKRQDGYLLSEAAEKTGLFMGALEGTNKIPEELVTITVDGREIQAVKGQNLMEACLANGIDIPHLCYHGDTSSYGACRLCMVKIEGMRDLAASCCIKAEEGMKVTSTDDEIEEYRKVILELMMSSGNHQCLTCNKGVPTPLATCELQTLVRNYGITESRFETLYEKRPIDDTSETILYDANKCVLCGRCVRACEEIAGLSNLGFVNRGEKTVVVPGLNTTMNQSACVSCMECVNVCPTGALSVKVVQFSGENWDKKRKYGI